MKYQYDNAVGANPPFCEVVRMGGEGRFCVWPCQHLVLYCGCRLGIGCGHCCSTSFALLRGAPHPLCFSMWQYKRCITLGDALSCCGKSAFGDNVGVMWCISCCHSWWRSYGNQRVARNRLRRRGLGEGNGAVLLQRPCRTRRQSNSMTRSVVLWRPPNHTSTSMMTRTQLLQFYKEEVMACLGASRWMDR